MRMILEDIDVKVFRSHVKIPMIFLVPALLLLSLYVITYLVANSLFFQTQLQSQVNAFFPGTIQVKELVISPTFQSIGLYDGGFQDTRDQKILTVERIDLKLNLSSLLLRRLKVTSAKLYGVDLELVIDPETARLNLLDGLFLLPPPGETPPKSEPLDFTFDFNDVSFERSRFRFVAQLFEFEVPRVDIPQGEVHVTPETLMIKVPSWRVAAADFRFRHAMFGNVPDAGD